MQVKCALHLVLTVGALIFKSSEEPNKLKNLVSMFGHGSVYAMAPKNASEQFRYWMANNYKKNKEIQAFFSMQSTNKMAKNRNKKYFLPIETNMKIFVPPLTPELELDETERYDSLTDETFLEIVNDRSETVRVEGTEFHTNRLEHDPNTHVKIRVLHNKPVSADSPQKCDFAILQFHGGGFVMGDSCSHQNYTRKWAIDLGIPVFCVDYRLAPQHPFPTPINDCYQAYMWLVTQAKDQLGLDIDKWIFAGDSAGGHLTFSVTMVAMLRGARLPDAVFSHYPVYVTSNQYFNPSMVLCLDEELVNLGFMSYGRGAFTIKGGDNEKNVLLSPLLAPDEMLKRFPPSKIMAVENDPLRDQAYDMTLRILKLGGSCKLILMKDYIHGFQNFDKTIDEYKIGTLKTIEHFASLHEQIR